MKENTLNEEYKIINKVTLRFNDKQVQDLFEKQFQTLQGSLMFFFAVANIPITIAIGIFNRPLLYFISAGSSLAYVCLTRLKIQDRYKALLNWIYVLAQFSFILIGSYLYRPVANEDGEEDQERVISIYLKGMTQIMFALTIIFMNIYYWVQVKFILIYYIVAMSTIGVQSSNAVGVISLFFGIIFVFYMMYMREYNNRLVFYDNLLNLKMLERFKNIMYHDIPSPILVLHNEDFEKQDIIFSNKSFHKLFNIECGPDQLSQAKQIETLIPLILVNKQQNLSQYLKQKMTRLATFDEVDANIPKQHDNNVQRDYFNLENCKKDQNLYNIFGIKTYWGQINSIVLIFESCLKQTPQAPKFQSHHNQLSPGKNNPNNNLILGNLLDSQHQHQQLNQSGISLLVGREMSFRRNSINQQYNPQVSIQNNLTDDSEIQNFRNSYFQFTITSFTQTLRQICLNLKEKNNELNQFVEQIETIVKILHQILVYKAPTQTIYQIIDLRDFLKDLENIFSHIENSEQLSFVESGCTNSSGSQCQLKTDKVRLMLLLILIINYFRQKKQINDIILVKYLYLGDSVNFEVKYIRKSQSDSIERSQEEQDSGKLFQYLYKEIQKLGPQQKLDFKDKTTISFRIFDQRIRNLERSSNHEGSLSQNLAAASNIVQRNSEHTNRVEMPDRDEQMLRKSSNLLDPNELNEFSKSIKVAEIKVFGEGEEDDIE